MLTQPARLAAGSHSPAPFTIPDACRGATPGGGAGQPLDHGAMTPTYKIRLATADDVRPIHGLIGSAADWLRDFTDQWAKPWPDEATRDARIEQAIQARLTWMVADSKGELVGTMTCREHGNDMLWTPEEQAEPAVYVSRLIVRRDRAGLGIGSALIDWAGQHGIGGWRARWIRVDVWTTNLALHRYYKGQGFEHLRTLFFEDYWEYPSAALFQKPTADVNEQAAARFELEVGDQQQVK
jgi:ribosomal protein S18 acetylase RimI-like enzyme